jgi:polar amino acid transport system substrate-binding protein
MMGTPEHFGLVLAKGSSLTHCVDDALVRLRASGTLAALEQKWLAKVGGAPVLK